MSGRRTIGYLVVDGTGRPMLWDEPCKRFFRFDGKAATLFPAGSYSYVRGRVRMHQRSIRDYYELRVQREINQDLKIVRLLDPLRYE
jgi:hypothetical protein